MDSVTDFVPEENRIDTYRKVLNAHIRHNVFPLHKLVFIGETRVDKLALTRRILEKENKLREWKGKAGDFVVVDSGKKIRCYRDLLKILHRYREAPIVVFDNCAAILRNDDRVLVFKYLCEGDRRFSGTNWGSFADFTVSSYYIFLCDTDPMDKLRDVRREVFCIMSQMV
jgi:hypothetical protein